MDHHFAAGHFVVNPDAESEVGDANHLSHHETVLLAHALKLVEVEPDAEAQGSHSLVAPCHIEQVALRTLPVDTLAGIEALPALEPDY